MAEIKNAEDGDLLILRSGIFRDRHALFLIEHTTVGIGGFVKGRFINGRGEVDDMVRRKIYWEGREQNVVANLGPVSNTEYARIYSEMRKWDEWYGVKCAEYGETRDLGMQKIRNR